MEHIANIAHKALYDVSDAGTIADELGQLRAKMKELKTAQEVLENLLKAGKVGTASGKDYFVTISYDAQRKTVDWKSIAEKLEPSRQLVSAHTKVSVFDRVNVKAHNK